VRGSSCSDRYGCAPNAKEFGYTEGEWRTWPGEVRADVIFPGSVGREVFRPPAGEKRQPMLPQEIVPPSGRDPYVPPGGGNMPPLLPNPPGSDMFLPGAPTIEGIPPILPEPGIQEPSLDPVFPDTFTPGMPAEPALEPPGGIDSPVDLPKDSGPGATPGGNGATPTAPPAGEPAIEPSVVPPLKSPGGGVQLPPSTAPDLVAYNPLGGVAGTSRQPLPAAPGQSSEEPDAVPANSKPAPQESLSLPPNLDPAPAEPEPLPSGSESVLAPPQLLPPVIDPAPAEPQPPTPSPGLPASSPELPADDRQPLLAAPSSSPAASELPPGDTAPERRVAKSLQANWTAALHPDGRGDSGASRSVYPAQPATTQGQQTAAAAWPELDVNGISHETPVTPGTYSGNSPPVALDGFCPVELVGSENWAPGDPRWSAVHEGRTYLFSSEAHLRRFRTAPQQFAPALSGQDPVLAVDGNRRVPGQTDYCVTYKGRLYMFSSSVTLTRFRKTPSRYTGGGSE